MSDPLTGFDLDRAVHQSLDLPGFPRPYSTDIAAAWQVVEKLRGRFQHLCLTHKGHWHVIMWKDEESPIIAASGDTAPEAICRAALATREDR